MTPVRLRVNDRPVFVEVPARTSLADLIREHLGLTGTHLGCEHGVCGACTVLLDEKPVRSCIVLAVACEDRDVRTIEGFESDAAMAALRDAFKREHALQCGFCTPGMLIAARDIALRLDKPDESRIRRELSGNLCRCTGYVGIIKAVQSVGSRNLASRIVEKPSSNSSGIPIQNTSETRSSLSDKLEPSRDARAGWTELAESFSIDTEADALWTALLDIPFVASCLPGAEISEFEDGHVKGRMTVKLGPLRAVMTGSAIITHNDATKTAELRGGGSDRLSGSRTQGRLVYSVKHNPNGAGSIVDVSVAYSIQGLLAQFARSGLTQEVGRLLVRQFADTLNRRLRKHGNNMQHEAAQLSLWSLIRAVLAGVLKRVFKG